MSWLRRASSLLPLAALALAGACSSAAIRDAGPAFDGGVALPPRQLVFEGEPVRALAPGDHLPFTLRYTESDGTPVAGATITLALVGSAHDSTLLATSAVTGTDGRAAGTLVAGATNATFDVRAAADRATPAHLDVAVSSAGFGGVQVSLSYAGARVFASRTAGVVARASCVEALASAALDREVPVTSPGTSALLASLPAGESYAVVARGLGLDGAVVAAGCVAGVAVTADMVSAASVVLEDLPPHAAGAYDVAITLVAESSSLTLESAVTDAASHVIGTSDGAFYLDAVQVHLRTIGHATAADALAAARASGSLDSDLDTALVAAGPSATAAALAHALGNGTRGLVVGGVLTAPAVGAVPPGALAVTDVLTSGFVDLAPSPVRLSVATSPPAVSPTATLEAVADTATGAIIVHQLVVTLPLGATARALILARRTIAGAATTADLLTPAAGCDALVSWGATTSPISTSCDASCLRLSCGEALSTLATAIDAALGPLDSTRGAVALLGVVTLTDADGDGLADTLGPATLAGTWGTGSIHDGDPIGARFEAVRE